MHRCSNPMFKTFAVLGILALTAGALAAPPAYYNLGANRFVSGLSADGTVAAAYVSSGAFYRWTPGGGIVSIDGVASAGQAKVSHDGTRICGMTLNPITNLREMSYYDSTTATWTGLGGIGGSSGSETSSGWGISGDGQSVVGLGWVSAASAHAIHWRNGLMTDLGSTVAGRSTRANAADYDGSVIVGWQDSATGFRQAAVWNNGVQTLIFDNANNPVSEASAVDAAGYYVTGIGTSGQQAWRWNPDTGHEPLGTLGIPGGRGYGTGITADGQTIVGFERPFGPPLTGQGFLWRQGVGLVNLTTYALSKGVPLPGGTVLALPLAISADGSTVAGMTSAGNGFVVVFPEPASLGGLFSILGAIAAVRRR